METPMSILCDWEIKELAEREGMISPFRDKLLSEVNGRRILSYGLSSYGYDIRLSPKQCLIFGRIQKGDCDPKDFDVNVHPTKAEVRFRNAEGLFSLIVSAIRRSLEVSHRASELAPALSAPADPCAPLPERLVTTPEFSIRPLEVNTRQLGLSLPVQALSLYSYLGVIDRTYLVARRDEDLYLFDQHALHERILYERLLREFQVESRVKSQRLLFPQTLRFEQAEKLLEHEELLQRLGFEVRQWKEFSISILATPALLRREPEKILKKFIECVELPVETMARDVLATMACHSAVRAHDVLASAEVEELFRQFDSQDALGHCPHGRPTFVRWTGRVLDKLFHRIL
jgi:DNA mismatch repair protein MutL